MFSESSRVLSWKAFNCALMYTAFWPARLGHCSLVLLPLAPWHATQVEALVAPASAEPAAMAIGDTMELKPITNIGHIRRIIDIMCSRPTDLKGCSNCTPAACTHEYLSRRAVLDQC